MWLICYDSNEMSKIYIYEVTQEKLQLQDHALPDKGLITWLTSTQMIIWCFTSLSTLFKSYWDYGRVIMKGSVQWTT